MKCKAIQRYLLGLENPGQPEPVIQAHVDRCPACFEWQRRLALLERHVPLLPVPATNAKDRFRQQLLEPTEKRRGRTAKPKRLSVAEGRLGRAWQRHPLVLGLTAGGLAAALVLLLLGAWMSSLSNSPTVAPNLAERTPDPLLENLLRQDLQLAKKDTPRKQVETLADMADVLQVSSHRLAQTVDAEELQELSTLVQRIVRDGIVPQAQNLPIDEREQVLKPILGRLSPEGNKAQQPTSELPAPAASPPWQTTLLQFDPAELARRLHRNRPLIKSLVDGGLLLAAESDPLKRAGVCNVMADNLADEIKNAAKQREGPRALELGKHYQALLQSGVALNLSTARLRYQPGSVGEKQMLHLGAQVVKIARPLQDQLERASRDPDVHEDMQLALQSVFEGRTEVEKSLKGRGINHNK